MPGDNDEDTCPLPSAIPAPKALRTANQTSGKSNEEQKLYTLCDDDDEGQHNDQNEEDSHSAVVNR